MKKHNLLLPLNIDNLINFLVAGIITSKNNFPKGNYTPDSLSLSPDLILLYSNKVPQTAVEMVKEYNENLFECMLTITLNLDEIELNKISRDKVLSISTPIPTSSIAEIKFENKAAKDKFTRAIKNSGVISESILLTKSSVTGYSKLIEPSSEPNLAFEEDLDQDNEFPSKENNSSDLKDQHILTSIDKVNIEPKPLDYPKVSAYGAVITLLFVMSKNGIISDKLFKAFISGELNTLEIEGISKDFIKIYYYFHQKEEHLVQKNEQEDNEYESFNMILDIIINNDKSSMLDNLILHLKSSASANLERFQMFFAGIGQQMQDIYQSTETRTTKELVSDLSTSFERTNIKLYFSFFAIKSDIETLLNTQVEGLREQDYLMLAIFYGMRDGYESLPKFIRSYEGIENFVSNMMVQYASPDIEGNTCFSKDKRPSTLLDLLDSKLNIETKQSIVAKLNLDRAMSIGLKAKDFNYVNGAISIPLTANPKFSLLRNEKTFTEVMSKMAPKDFIYNDLIKLANK